MILSRKGAKTQRITLTPSPAGAQEHHLRPFGGTKVRWTFVCFRLTSRKREREKKHPAQYAALAPYKSCHFERSEKSCFLSTEPAP